MSYFWRFLKTNIRLLLRNKGFVFFFLIAPVVSVIILNLHVENSLYDHNEEWKIREMSDDNEKVVYLNDWTDYSIKVFDGAGTDLSEHLLNRLSKNGMFSVYRQRAEDMTEEEVLRQAENDAMNDRIGTILYLKPEFNENVINGNNEDAFLFYQVSEDERFTLLSHFFTEELLAIRQVSPMAFGKEEQIISILDSIEETMPEKKVVSLDGADELSLTVEQSTKKSLAGYAYSVMTLGFLFCGVCIAYTVIEEQENKMYTRVMISKAGRVEYLAAKFAMSLLISVMQTGELAVYTFLLRDLDFGIPKPAALLFIFLMGLIFNVLSLEIGILIGDVMSANYAVFAVWSVSSLLSGCYFSIEGSSRVIKVLSYLMPQRWFMRGTELLMAGKGSVYSMIGCITLAYLIILFCIGAVGLKMKESEA